MINVNYLNPRMIIADEGMALTNGEVIASVVYLGKDESLDNWTEIPKEESE